MEDKHMLMIPGPTPVPEKVLLAMAKRPIGHRSGDFSKIIAEINDNLKWLHQTKNEVLTLNVSGTGAMEAGMINFLSPGDRVLVGVNGKFGDRWAQISETFGLDTVRISAEWGQPLDPGEFQTHLESDSKKEIKAVIITHSETSTGVLNDLETINKHVKAHGEALIIVDAVTSLGAYNVPVDEWGLDVVGSGSQKGYMVPPGLGFLSVSDKAWQAYETCKFPRFYMDLGKYKKANLKASTPFTPPVNLMYGLQISLQMMQREGLEGIFSRHQRLTNMTRAAVKALGLQTFAADEVASTAVTAVTSDTVNTEDIRKIMSSKYGITLAGGQDHLKGKIFRIGHLGFVSDRDMLTGIACLEATLSELGHKIPAQAGVKAAAAQLV
ncbi:serine-pyruvate aminotransferase/archaeal aspartate aminotransferase [Xenococcus sp. PCC 7305]|uniref:pyridoxal-phosphate-dependent aminotransferase family protein n=1 Tax=Xenococcus sp. PCC 7305 TaxID=102125 RepID=UPI0002ABC9E6|nr:alanine--glyoxylate aminotransferase family protein [Xenococcus sp. PCC 7305]ELS03516.1 serine-pyruvate aminotransferase/archaeal aspartate aminotransferase [Xenococcus sp. PCC 7305]